MRRVIRKEHVRLDDPPPALPTDAEGASTEAEHELRLIRVGERVTAVEQTCSCEAPAAGGQNSLFAAEFPEPSGSKGGGGRSP